jgi:hypothetical protein
MNDAKRETLVSSVFDVAQDFVSSYDFASLVESDDNDNPKALQFSSFASWMNFLYIDNNSIGILNRRSGSITSLFHSS